MHRATPRNTLSRSYNSGGSAITIDSVDDGKQMQEIGGGMMKGEHRTKIERPQNYGFSSVPHEPDKDEEGNIKKSAQGFCQFMGGSRSYPVATAIDDRRHRLKGQKAGDVAFFRGKADGQQFDLIDKGNFISAGNGKINRIALVPNKVNEKKKNNGNGGGTAAAAAAAYAEGNGGGTAAASTSAEGGSGDEEEDMGQNPVYDENLESETYIQQSKDGTTFQHSKDKSVSVTNKRAFMRFGGLALWIDDSGIHSTAPITVAPLPED